MRTFALSLLLTTHLCVGCGSGSTPDTSVSSVNSQDQSVIVNINDPACELEEVLDCSSFVVNLTCSGNLAGARSATCSECPGHELCIVDTEES